MDFKLSDSALKEMVEQIVNTAPKKSTKMTNEEWESGKKYTTKTGIKVRSKIEKIILDLYAEWGVVVEYEKKLRFSKMKNPKEKFTVYCDFYLPDYDIYHEHFGLEDQAYTKRKEIKKAAFNRYKMKFIATDATDEPDIEKAIIRKLKYIGVEVQ